MTRRTLQQLRRLRWSVYLPQRRSAVLLIRIIMSVSIGNRLRVGRSVRSSAMAGNMMIRSNTGEWMPFLTQNTEITVNRRLICCVRRPIAGVMPIRWLMKTRICSMDVIAWMSSSVMKWAAVSRSPLRMYRLLFRIRWTSRKLKQIWVQALHFLRSPPLEQRKTCSLSSVVPTILWWIVIYWPLHCVAMVPVSLVKVINGDCFHRLHWHGVSRMRRSWKALKTGSLR